ncbi:MAG: hypothetical protein Q9208_001210 [Pyrenodesmia sp. 3 TL-2023]
MKASHSRLALILLFLCLLSIHQASSHALPANPQIPAVRPLPQLGDAAAIERTVDNLVRALAVDPDIRYREAVMITIAFAVDRIEDDIPEADRTFSSNISDFRDIVCIFRYGGPPPHSPNDAEFSVKNQFPLHWDQWFPPQPSPWRGFASPFSWDLMTRRMGIGMADALLKASGQTGRYVGVALKRLDFAFMQIPVAWCFHRVETRRGERTNFRVDVLSRQVTRVDSCV